MASHDSPRLTNVCSVDDLSELLCSTARKGFCVSFTCGVDVVRHGYVCRRLDHTSVRCTLFFVMYLLVSMLCRRVVLFVLPLPSTLLSGWLASSVEAYLALCGFLTRLPARDGVECAVEAT